VALYKAGEQWHLTSEEAEQAAERVKDYKTEDPWEDEVLGHADGKEAVRVGYILEWVLKIPQDRMNSAAKNRVESILRSEGWIKGKRRVEGFPNPVAVFTRGPSHKDLI
jgi:predicted P-loop ATPase